MKTTEDEFISNSYFFPCSFGFQTLENGKRKKIGHPIVDARGRRKFCRLVYMSLYAAGGHDWSKT
jgi:hypothetical protein